MNAWPLSNWYRRSNSNTKGVPCIEEGDITSMPRSCTTDGKGRDGSVDDDDPAEPVEDNNNFIFVYLLNDSWFPQAAGEPLAGELCTFAVQCKDVICE